MGPYARSMSMSSAGRASGSGGVRGAVMAREGVSGGEKDSRSVCRRVSWIGGREVRSLSRDERRGEVGDLGLVGLLMEGAVWVRSGAGRRLVCLEREVRYEEALEWESSSMV